MRMITLASLLSEKYEIQDNEFLSFYERVSAKYAAKKDEPVFVDTEGMTDEEKHEVANNLNEHTYPLLKDSKIFYYVMRAYRLTKSDKDNDHFGQFARLPSPIFKSPKAGTNQANANHGHKLVQDLVLAIAELRQACGIRDDGEIMLIKPEVVTKYLDEANKIINSERNVMSMSDAYYMRVRAEQTHLAKNRANQIYLDPLDPNSKRTDVLEMLASKQTNKFVATLNEISTCLAKASDEMINLAKHYELFSPSKPAAGQQASTAPAVSDSWLKSFVFDNNYAHFRLPFASKLEYDEALKKESMLNLPGEKLRSLLVRLFNARSTRSARLQSTLIPEIKKRVNMINEEFASLGSSPEARNKNLREVRDDRAQLDRLQEKPKSKAMELYDKIMAERAKGNHQDDDEDE
jgi:hypothetical protein